MESLGESDADQLVEITSQGGPARVLVVAQAEQVDVPSHEYFQTRKTGEFKEQCVISPIYSNSNPFKLLGSFYPFTF